jgi:hypothetical protein
LSSKGIRLAILEAHLSAGVSETVSENSGRVMKNSGALSQIVLVFQRENPYSPRI